MFVRRPEMQSCINICAITNRLQATSFTISQRFICGITQLKIPCAIERSYAGPERASLNPRLMEEKASPTIGSKRKKESVSLLGFVAIWIASLMIIGVAIWSAVKKYDDMRDFKAFRQGASWRRENTTTAHRSKSNFCRLTRREGWSPTETTSKGVAV